MQGWSEKFPLQNESKNWDETDDGSFNLPGVFIADAALAGICFPLHVWEHMLP